MEKAMREGEFPVEQIEFVEEERKELAAKEFATEIKRLRNKARLSQRALGSLIGVEQTIMVRIEKGEYGVTLDLVLRLASAFHDDPHRLASIYWGTGSDHFVNANKKVLDEIWDLMYPFYQSKSRNSNTSKLTGEARQRLKGAKEEEADILADLTPDVKPPQNNTPPENKGQPIIKPESTENCSPC